MEIVITWLLKHNYITIALLITILISIVVIIIRVNQLLSKINNIIKKNEILEKRVTKIIYIIGGCPSQDIETKLWLQDDKRNGGQPPKPSKCIKPFKGCNNIEKEQK